MNSYSVPNEQIDNKGAGITGYSTDFAGITRNAATPDLGAYEFTYVMPTVVPNCTTLKTPPNTSTGNVPNPITLNWSPAEYATGYKLYLGTTPGGAEIVNGTVLNTLLYTINLEKNKKYYAKVISTNNVGDAAGCSETSFSTAEYSFCTLVFSNVEPISNVKFAGIDNSSSSELYTGPGYQYFTNLIGQVSINSSPSITVAGNTTTNGSMTSYYSVFIDWNQNGILNDAGEVYFGDGSLFITNSTGEDGKLATGTITIPTNAKTGLTGMRVKKEYSGGSPSSTGNFVNPCDTAQNLGQAEDYTLNVSDATLTLSDLDKTKLSVYPNPFTDILRISDVKDLRSVSVNDMTGKEVKSLTAVSELNLGNLNAGLYIVNLQLTDGSVRSFKVVKK